MLAFWPNVLRKNWKEYWVWETKGIYFKKCVVFSTDWKNYSPVQSPLDFAVLEKEYSSNFALKQETRRNLWYHRKAHKRANHFIQHLNKEMVEERTSNGTEIPAFKGGDAIEVYLTITNGSASTYWTTL